MREAFNLPASPSFREPAPAFAFSPDGKTLITGHERGGAQRWDVTTGSRVGAPLPHGGMVCGVAFSPDGTAILTGCGDGTVRIWDSSTGQPLGAPFGTGQTVSSVAFGPDGKSILIGTGSDGRSGAAYLWDVATRAKLAGPFTHQDVGPRRRVQPRWHDVPDREPGRDRPALGAGYEPADRAPLSGIGNGVYNALFTPDGATVLTRSRDDLSAFLWEAATGQRIGTPLWHSGPLDCLAVSPDGRTVLSGGVDQTARLWEIGRNRSRPLDPSLRIETARGPEPAGRAQVAGLSLEKDDRLQPRPEDRADQRWRADRAALGDLDRPAARRPAAPCPERANGRLQPGREAGRHGEPRSPERSPGQLFERHPPLGRGHRPAAGASHLAIPVGLGAGVQPGRPRACLGRLRPDRPVLGRGDGSAQPACRSSSAASSSAWPSAPTARRWPWGPSTRPTRRGCGTWRPAVPRAAPCLTRIGSWKSPSAPTAVCS